MLLKFYVENFLSFKEEVCLDMTPAKSRTMKDHIIHDKKGKVTEALPIAVIYGANAGGKSNIIKAMEFVKDFVNPIKNQDEKIGVTPYLLDPKTAKQPSRFELVFKEEGVLYTYGLVVSAEKVHEEWLFARYTARETKVFTRTTDEKGKTTVEAGAPLIRSAGGEDARGGKGFIAYVAQGMRPEQNFLREALNKNIKLLEPIQKWFILFCFVDSFYSSSPFATTVRDDEEFINYRTEFMKIADTGIEQVLYREEEFNEEQDFKGISSDVRNCYINAIKQGELPPPLPLSLSSIIVAKNDEQGNRHFVVAKTKAEHIRSDDSAVHFDFEHESDGTRRLIELMPMLFVLQKIGGIFVIDELDRSLHTHLVQLVVETFIKNVKEKNKENNDVSGQMIVTTHDTNLLDKDLLRRDEILLMEKDKSGASRLSRLSDYKINDGLNYESAYINGRFGAVPVIRGAETLLEKPCEK